MKLKVITGILLILLLTNIITTLNVTSVFAFVNNSLKTENRSGDLLKNVNSNKTLNDAVNSTNTGYSNFWDFSGKNQTNAKLGYWGTNSTEVVVGLSDAWEAYGKMEQLALTENGKIVNKVLMGGKVEAVVIDVPQDSVASFATEVKENGSGRYVEPSVKYQAFMVPNDPYWSLQWGPQKIQADYAWNTTTGSKTVLVCVIDTGIDYNHPDLWANYVPLGYNWVSNNSDVLDDNGHGTHCAGIIGAGINNGVGIAGLAQVRIMAEKGLDANGMGYDFNLANAIYDATNKGAKIISMSWGSYSPSTVIEDALKYAYDHGVLLVAAAGNSGSSTKSYPAAYPEVIAVTATDQADQLAYFSSYGNWVELAAPGVNIYSTTPTYPVTLTNEGVATMNYSYLSGTSMACPHVVGVAALVWSEFPNMSRDVLRLHLRDTADDLGTPGFDVYYGYGRINARRAVEEPLPLHDIVVASWEKPPYVEPNSTGTINATLLNYGRYDETNVTTELIINGSILQSFNVSLTSGSSTTVEFSWTPTQIGNYNVTVYVPTVTGETNTKNNTVQGYVYVGIPLRIFVLRSAGTQSGGSTDAWQALNDNWKKFGNRLISIDYTTLDKNNITYKDLNATRADVLVISCAWQWQYSDAEIAAIKKYVYEGHGFIATAGTFYNQVPNNNKFASMFGLNESEIWVETVTDLLELLNPSHPLFAGVPNPYTIPSGGVGTAVPSGGIWTANELVGGKYVAMGYYNESAIVVYQGLVYISPWLEVIPERYNFNLQILYNAMTWSHYVKPDHELAVSLEAPTSMFPNSTILLNATVTNNGAQNETNVNFSLSIYDTTHNKSTYYHPAVIPLLKSGESYPLNFTWNPGVKGIYNVTAYAVPVPLEQNVQNNKAAALVNVAPPIIAPKEGQWAQYKVALTYNATGQPVDVGEMELNYSKYLSPTQINVTILEYSNTTTQKYQVNMVQGGWTVVDVVNRYCESGVWKDLWFPGMIETNVTIGSNVNILSGPATVTGSEILVIGTKLVDCWMLSQNYGNVTYTWWYAKTNGLWMQLDFKSSLSNAQIHEIIKIDGTNIPVGFTPDHELQVTLEAPNVVPLGYPSTINATVANRGLRDEKNITLILEINKTLVERLTLPELKINYSQTMPFLWTPTSLGNYNVTAQALVPGENLTITNTATVFVKVVTTKGRVLLDQTHLADPASSYSSWIDSLRTAGYIVDLYENTTRGITSDVLTGYDAFVTINPRQYYSPQEFSAITEFVAKGGGLLVVGDDNPIVCNRLTYFADIAWTYGGTPGTTTNITPHEVTEGVSTVFLLDPNAMIYQSSAQALVRDYSGNIMLAVNWHKGGRVMGFTDQDSLRDYVIGSADNLRLATNMITWLCEKDTTPPQILLVAPSNGTMIRATSVTMNWTATDSQSGLDKYSIYRNGQFVANTTNGQFVGNTTTQFYIVPNLIEGSNNVTIVAYDRAGNHASAQVTIIVVLTPPKIEILTPANNSYVKQVVVINVSGSDAYFGHMELRIDANKVATFNTNGTHTYSWNTSSESYGTHRITLTAVDTFGNNASSTITVTVDNIPPTVSIVSPTNNNFVRGNITITFIAQDLDLENTSLMIGSTIIISQPFDTTTLSDGNYTVKLVAYDWAGNRAETRIAIAIDNTPPEISSIKPSNGTVIGTATVTMYWMAADNQSGIDKYSIYRNSHFVANTTLDFYVLSNLTEGSNNLTIVAYDKAGNSVSDHATIIVDLTPPEAHITYPTDNSYVKGKVNVNFTFADADSNVEEATLLLDGKFLANVTSTTYYLWDTASPRVSDGNHTLTLTVVDKAGNIGTAEVTVAVDNTSPTGEILALAPSNGAYIKGTVDITFYGNDANLHNMTLKTNSTIAGTWNESGTHNYAWNTTQLKDGSCVILLAIYDRAGNQFTTQVTVRIDNTLPMILIKSPQNGAVLSRKATINFSTTDNYPTPVTVFLYINNTQIGMYSNQGSYQWDTTKVIDGNYTIKAVATDSAGNIKESTLTVTVSNAPPAYVTYTGYAAVGILGLALGALAVWLLLKRKPSSPKAPAT